MPNYLLGVDFKYLYHFSLGDCAVGVHFIGENETHLLVYALRAGVHCRLDLKKIKQGMSSVCWMRPLDGFV